MSKFRIKRVSLYEFIGKYCYKYNNTIYYGIYQVEKKSWLGFWRKVEWFLSIEDAEKCLEDLVNGVYKHSSILKEV